MYQEPVTTEDNHTEELLSQNVNSEPNAIPSDSSELDWVNNAESVLQSIKENVSDRSNLNVKLQNIQPEIQLLLTALAEKQAEEEQVKEDIELMELELQELKEKLVKEMSA